MFPIPQKSIFHDYSNTSEAGSGQEVLWNLLPGNMTASLTTSQINNGEGEPLHLHYAKTFSSCTELDMHVWLLDLLTLYAKYKLTLHVHICEGL